MNSVPAYRDFVAVGAPAPGPRQEPARQEPARQEPALARRSLLRRVADAIERSRQRAIERHIVRALGLDNPGTRFTDATERRLYEHLTGDRGFRP